MAKQNFQQPLIFRIEKSNKEINSSDTVDAPLQNELVMNAMDLEAESWSLAVEPQFCKMQEKRIVKRQDVIYGQLKQSSSLKTFCAGVFCS